MKSSDTSRARVTLASLAGATEKGAGFKSLLILAKVIYQIYRQRQRKTSKRTRSSNPDTTNDMIVSDKPRKFWFYRVIFLIPVLLICHYL